MGDVTYRPANSDKQNQDLPKPKKVVHHSPASELFREGFPLFVNRYHEGFILREHDHDFIEINYILSGDGFHYVGDTMERTSKGCLYLLPVGTSHILRPSGASPKEKLVVYNLCIRPEFVEMLAHWLSPYGESREALSIFTGKTGSHMGMVDRSMELAGIFEQLYREFEENKPGYEASMFSLLLQLTIHIYRHWKYMDGSGDAAEAAGLRYTGMSSVLDYVNGHITEPLTLERLAESIGMSRRHLIRLFQQSAGMGFSEYLQHKRMELACRLLLQTDEKIETIAKQTGYRDLTHFRQVFRKHIGTGPNQYRKNQS